MSVAGHPATGVLLLDLERDLLAPAELTARVLAFVEDFKGFELDDGLVLGRWLDCRAELSRPGGVSAVTTASTV